MYIGQKVSCVPTSFHEKDQRKTPKRHTGRIVYIHPRELWAVVEFDTRGGKVRESFFPHELTVKK